jgi:hypothetical protein
VNLALVDENTAEVVNNVYLYPHTYLRFYPDQNRYIVNADILKLTQRFTLNYF